MPFSRTDCYKGLRRSFLRHQFFVIALLDDVSILQNQDQIGIADRRKTMGDDEARSAFHQVIHGLLDLNFRSRIDGARGLIQNQDRIVRQNGPGQSSEAVSGPEKYCWSPH